MKILKDGIKRRVKHFKSLFQEPPKANIIVIEEKQNEELEAKVTKEGLK